MDRTLDNPVNPVPQWPRRLWQFTLLATLHDLKRSVHRGQPMSLPNLLRRFQRRLCDVGIVAGDARRVGLQLVRRMYRRHQPFGDVNWHEARSALLGE